MDAEYISELHEQVNNLIATNQTAIKEIEEEVMEIKARQMRDMKDQWKMISELTDELKEAQVTIRNLKTRIELLEAKHA